ncbi:MAG: hypothetical protein AAF478_11795, partial [Pseudomonadota bacterium]
IQSFAPEPSEEDPVAATVEAEQAVRIAALSPTEIEDLRRQVYSVLRSDADKVAEPIVPANSENEVQLASTADSTGEEISNRLSLAPQPNPRREVERVIDQQIAVLEPIEPGAKSSDELAVPQVNPRIETDEIQVASLQPLEPGVKASGELALPLPNPAAAVTEAEQPEAPSNQISSNIPVPQLAPRPILVASNDTDIDANPQSRLEQFDDLQIDERVLGKWALAADISIAQIADIRPPAYARNIIRELPTTVLSGGFSRDSRGRSTDRFTGSSVEFLDFTRFN